MSLGAITFALAAACLVFARQSAHLAAIWPVNAVVLAVLLRAPSKRWPLLATAGLAGGVLSSLVVGDHAPIAVALGFCNGLEVMLAASLLRRGPGAGLDLRPRRALMTFLIVAGALAPLLSACAAAAVLTHAGVGFWASAFAWYVPDALGLVTVAPALVALTGPPLRALAQRLSRAAGWTSVATLAASLAVVFTQQQYPLLFLIPPALIFVAFQLEIAGAAVALLASAVIAVVATLTGHGPATLIHGPLTERLAVLQLFLATLTVAVLPVAAAIGRQGRLRRRLTAALARAQAKEAELSETQRLSRMAKQIAGVGYWRRRLDTGATVWSPQMFALHGLPPVADPDAAYRSGIDLYDADSQRQLQRAIAEVARTGEPFDLKVSFRRADDQSRRTVLLKGEAEHDREGRATAIFGVMRDVTDEEAARRRLEESEAHFRLLADSATDILLQVDGKDNVTYVSPSIGRYGYDPAKLIGTKGASYIHPDDVQTVLDRVARLARGETFDPLEDRSYRMLRGDGGHVWIEGSSSTVRNPDGSVRVIVCQLRDVSERRAAIAALAKSETRHRLLTENMTDVVACYRRDGVLTYLSPGVEALLGYTPAELLGTSIVAFMHPDDLPGADAHFKAAFAEGPGADPFRFEYRVTTKAGEMIWLEAHPRAIYDDAGRFVEWQDVVRDVTARKGMETALEEAAAVKAEFMANVSHEIRTPLTAILGFTKLLGGDASLSDVGRSHLQRVSGAGQALLAIVNDVLDFSKLEAGQFEIRPEPCEPAEVIRDAFLMFQPQAEAKGLTLRLAGADQLPPCVSVDRHRLRQVLTNLLGNAIKFSDSGQISLDVAFDPGRSRLRFAIRDNGPGMSPEQVSRLFQRFSQVDASSANRGAGTGLGLAICKGLVEAMGGQIGARSTPGSGSVFHFDVRAPEASPMRCEAPGALAPAPQLAGVRILLADDEPANRNLVRAILAPHGVEITDAVDGAAALESALSMPFDLILLDGRMPKYSGPEVAAQLRCTAGPNDCVPILAFTADPDFDPAGGDFDGVVTKPISPAELVARLVDGLDWVPAAQPDSAHG